MIIVGIQLKHLLGSKLNIYFVLIYNVNLIFIIIIMHLIYYSFMTTLYILGFIYEYMISMIGLTTTICIICIILK